MKIRMMFVLAIWALATPGLLSRFCKSDSTFQPKDAPNAKAQIVFVGGDNTAGFAIFKKNLFDEGSKSIRLTHVSFSKTVAAGKIVDEKIPSISPKSKPRWSPDGSKIAFIGGGPIRWEGNNNGYGRVNYPNKQSEYTSLNDLWVMDSDGKKIKPLVQIQVNDSDKTVDDFRWSPDGKSIAFLEGSRKFWLGIVEVSTGKIKEFLRDEFGEGRWPTKDFCWSPDGKAIVVSTDGFKRQQICILRVDGKLIELTRGDEFIKNPFWWPDGKIIFRRGHAFVDLNSSFWIMDSDGNNQERIQKGRNIIDSSASGSKNSEYVYPFWLSGDGQAIAFQWRIYSNDPRGSSKNVLFIRKIEDTGLGEAQEHGLDDVCTDELDTYDIHFSVKTDK